MWERFRDWVAGIYWPWRPHRCFWRPVDVQVHGAGLAAMAGNPPRTVVLGRCPVCEIPRTIILEGRWTLAQVQGVPVVTGDAGPNERSGSFTRSYSGGGGESQSAPGGGLGGQGGPVAFGSSVASAAHAAHAAYISRTGFSVPDAGEDLGPAHRPGCMDPDCGGCLPVEVTPAELAAGGVDIPVHNAVAAGLRHHDGLAYRVAAAGSPHLPEPDVTSPTGWMCAGCGLPVERVPADEDRDTPLWRTAGSRNTACVDPVVRDPGTELITATFGGGGQPAGGDDGGPARDEVMTPGEIAAESGGLAQPPPSRPWSRGHP